MSYSLKWDLETIFPGGIDSPELTKRMDQLAKQVGTFDQTIKEWHPHQDAPEFDKLTAILAADETISNGFSETNSFVTAIQSADVQNKQAPILSSKLQQYYANYQDAYNAFTKKLTELSDDEWLQLSDSSLSEKQGLLFNLGEIREKGKQLLSDESESIINQLAIDGFKAWSSHYDTLVATISIEYKDEKLSAGQAFNRMMGDKDPNVREELFKLWEKAWSEKAPLFADTLNHLQGFRLSNYKLHQEDDFLQAPLKYNRMSKATLDAMWGTISANKQLFTDFLIRKAQIFGKEKMAWQDQDAPLIVGDLEETRYSFDEAANFIIENFEKFSPKMANFAQMAFEKSWIEAEDRPGKRPGGYCTSFSESKESRIFMTYGESINEVATLAHELGHAYHSHVMWDLPSLSQNYAMNVAETASTFAELIVADATLKQAKTKEEKINLIDIKMQNATAMFMNIHARFIFENNFYEARKQQVLSDEQISDLMVEAQKEAYHGALETYHPHFWASKLHFYMDDVPFYNFPYTFGYLFSMGIYAAAQKDGKDFEDKYIALLRDTASMTTEELAMKHLNVDLTKADFWQAGIDMLKDNVEEFLMLTEEYI